MRVLSLFSGVGGMDMGLERAGHEIVGMCEIDKQARRVLRRHWPNVPLHDDVTTFNVGAFRGRVDLVAGGSPCQDLSVAGRRAGLDGQRSSLFWHQCRIADSVAAPWVLWENVAGAFSSNGGADFAAVLWGITGALPDVPDGGWRNMGICVGPKRTAVWRLLDAQWFGVPQRRRRVFVVGGPTDGRWLEVLLEPESSERHTRPSATPWQGVAALTSTGVAACGADDNQLVHVQCATGDVTHALTRSAYKGASEDGTGRGTPIVPVSFGWMNASAQGDDVVEDGVAPLRKSSHPAVLAVSENQRGEIRLTDYARPITTGGGKPGQGYPAVAVPIQDGRDLDKAQNGVGVGEPGDPSYTLDTTGAASVATPDLAVRRLTPVECERLMGWPDDWTRWADDGTEIADSHRYRMCGNGVVANVAEWIGRRLAEVEQ